MSYLEEELPDGKLGYTRILDPILIDEIKAFDGTGPGSRNVDRFMAFMWQCVHISMYYKYPPIVTRKESVAIKAPKAPISAFGNMKGTGMMSMGNFTPFGTIKKWENLNF